MMALDRRFFDYLTDARGGALSNSALSPRSYRKMANVVAIQTFDAMEIQRQFQRGKIDSNDYGANPLYDSSVYNIPLTNAALSIGMASPSKIGVYKEAVLEDFVDQDGATDSSQSAQSSTHRKSWFQYDTSRIPDGPLQEAMAGIQETLAEQDQSLTQDGEGPKQTVVPIGTVPEEARYCVVIRPQKQVHSYELLLAIRAGCIPVVVSDFYKHYAPTLKSTLHLDDFVVFVSEQDFLESPLQSLLTIQQRHKNIVSSKVEAVQFAQRVTMWSHERSLFVPALLEEILLASNNPFPQSNGYNSGNEP